MSQRRMFSPKIVQSDAFLDMPVSSQLLYFHLGMEADDDGFINPRKIMRMIGVSEDDLKILVAKRFVLPFENGVIVIKHWKINNLIKSDRYNPTIYQEQKSLLFHKENGVYTDRNPNGSISEPQVRLGKVSIGKNTISIQKDAEKEKYDPLGAELIKSFETINPACSKKYNNKTERQACDDLIYTYGFERVKKIIEITLPITNAKEYFPTITTPYELFKKWSALEAAIKKYQSKEISKKEKVGQTYW